MLQIPAVLSLSVVYGASFLSVYLSLGHKAVLAGIVDMAVNKVAQEYTVE